MTLTTTQPIQSNQTIQLTETINSTQSSRTKTSKAQASKCNQFKVNSDSVKYTTDFITSDYIYRDSKVSNDIDGNLIVTPTEQSYKFKTNRNLPKLGLMIVGWGGNNGSTVTATILANKQNLTWETKEGIQKSNYIGSLTQSSTFKIGIDEAGKDVFVPFTSMLPMSSPNDMIIGGWDISSFNLAASMKRAKVLDIDLQRQLIGQMETLKPLPSIYYPDFIAANQQERADNVLPGNDKQVHLDRIRKDIKSFKEMNKLDKVIVIWSANTERFADIIPSVNDTAANLLASVASSHPEVSPSTVFAMAAILEGCPFINGSPQNTFVPGCIELAEKHNVFVAGDDFKSGQTKLKSVIVDFLVNAGIKPLAITSYNHLGNNDGFNLSAPEQFRSKEISKSNVVDDMVAANALLYAPGEKPDHVVVIKHVKTVGDSKRALDEYVSEICMGGRSTISIYNVCEDSLLATPLIIDLVVLCELFMRIEYKTDGEWTKFHPVLSLLAYLLKAPVVVKGEVVNALGRQRSAIENVLRAVGGVAPNSEMALEHRCF